MYEQAFCIYSKVQCLSFNPSFQFNEWQYVLEFTVATTNYPGDRIYRDIDRW